MEVSGPLEMEGDFSEAEKKALYVNISSDEYVYLYCVDGFPVYRYQTSYFKHEQLLYIN